MAKVIVAASGCCSWVIPNWALEEGEPVDSSALRRDWGLGDAIVIGYSGNLGRAHRLDGLLAAAALLRDDSRYRFLIVGEGAQRAALEREAGILGLTNLQFRPFQPRERLREVLSLPDIHVASLDPRLEGLIVPSKVVGVLALSKPLLWLGASDGEVGDLVLASRCGWVAPPEDGEAIAGVIRAIDHDNISAASRSAHELWQKRFRREMLLNRWRDLLEEVHREQSQ